METSAEKSDRMLLLFGGIVSLILGILLFTQTGATLSVVMLLVGLSWFIWGIFSLLSIFIDKGEWGWRLFGGVIGIAAGWLVLSNPVASTVAVPAVSGHRLGRLWRAGRNRGADLSLPGRRLGRRDSLARSAS